MGSWVNKDLRFWECVESDLSSTASLEMGDLGLTSAHAHTNGNADS